MGRNNIRYRREVYCGVPQGSVLGPLLWNLAYDAVLRAELPDGVSVVCYADDTLVLAVGESFAGTTELAEHGVARVVSKIHELGLRVAHNKCEALWFHKLPRSREPPDSLVRVGDVQIRVGRFIRYLGLTLDGRWGFEEHIERLVPRVQRIVGALHRLLPNLGGPSEGVRRLYAGVVRSVALYGAPVWGHRLRVRRCRQKLHSLQRLIAIRIARGYRTISYEAATILARFLPFSIQAELDSAVFSRVREFRLRGESLPPVAIERLKAEERQSALRIWRMQLDEVRCTRQRVVGAILPNLEAWLRSRDHVTYHLTQVLTGHGCFPEYLCRFGLEATAQCYHCSSDLDSAQHTLAHCPAWDSERRDLVERIGHDLSLPAVVSAMLAGQENWRAVVSFCGDVMSRKEAAERERQGRRRRRGVTRRTSTSVPADRSVHDRLADVFGVVVARGGGPE